MQIPLEKKLEMERLIELQRQQRVDAQHRKIERHKKAVRRHRIRKWATFIILCALWLLVLVGFVRGIGAAEAAETFARPVTADKPAAITAATEARDEPELIEAALAEQGYFRDDVLLSYALQDYLHTAAEEAGISYELALAVVCQESTFRNVIGDDGASAGYMQIQKRWHADRMDRLGVTDLMDPYSNFRVGCDFLAELLDTYDGDLEDALTYYNSGSTGPSAYSKSVIEHIKSFA